MCNRLKIFLGFAILTAGCGRHVSTVRPDFTVSSGPVALVPSKTPDLKNTENIYSQSRLRAFQVGRYIDSQNTNLMHEAHTVYELVDDGRWNLNANLPAAIPMGDAVVVAVPENRSGATYAEVASEQHALNEAFGRLLDENTLLRKELQQVKQEIEKVKLQAEKERETQKG